MTNAVKELRIRAEILHKRLQSDESRALRRLRALLPFRRMTEDQILASIKRIKRRDCLNVIANELGFDTWLQAKAILSGEGKSTNFGTLLYRGGGHLNRWYVSYEEALQDREKSCGFLLAYKRDYLVVDRYFIASLTLDPDHEDWAAIDFNWVRPKSLPARTRLYDKLVASLPPEASR